MISISTALHASTRNPGFGRCVSHAVIASNLNINVSLPQADD